MINPVSPSVIRNSKDLEREIKLVKLRIKAHELDMKDRWKRLPEESIKATLGAIIPFFLRQKVASGTWALIKALSGMFLSGKEQPASTAGGIKDILLGSAKKWGVLAGVQGIIRLITKRNEKK